MASYKSILLPQSLAAWSRDDFKQVFKAEVALLDENSLPLQQGLSHSNLADGSDTAVLVLNASDSDTHIIVKAGIFYQGYTVGCNCSDDPKPMESENEYCEMMIEINKKTSKAVVGLVI